MCCRPDDSRPIRLQAFDKHVDQLASGALQKVRIDVPGIISRTWDHRPMSEIALC